MSTLVDADVETPAEPATRASGRRFHLLWFGEGASVLGNATTSVLLPLLAVVHLHAGPDWMSCWSVDRPRS